jgi:hypothetical protein
MRPYIITAWAVSLFTTIAGAQQVSRKEPVQYAGTERASRVEARPPGIRLGLRKPREFALAPLSESETMRLAEPGTRLKVGIHRNLPPEAVSTGRWETLASGTRVWRMALRSPGSRGIRVEFRNFSVGGGNVWLHDGDHVAGPYTGRGIFDNGEFWSGTVLSESVILEYEPAADAPEEQRPPFEIRTIAHHARAATLGRSNTEMKDPADYCELDANCYADWKSSLNTVALIAFEDGGNSVMCSGSLLATRDNSFKPYFLTAGHCIHSEAAARTVEAFWTYQTAACGGAPPASMDNSVKSGIGAHLISSGGPDSGDYSLVLLKDVPAGVTFAGWDITDPTVGGAPLTAIHHPSGSWKRISFGQRTGDATVVVEGSTAPGNLFLQVLWDKGRVEHGSSGSPLFSGPGVIVGSLSYGEVLSDGTVCTINPSVAGYSRFSNTYQHVKDYLENLPAALVMPDKANLSYSLSNHAAPAGQSVQLSTQSAGQMAFKLRADASWIKLSTTNGRVSANAPVQVTVSADTDQLQQPGQYSSTVTILSGAAAPQFINVTVNVALDQSNVMAAISPNPVTQSGGQWNLQVRLQETGGVATRVTQLKVNGADYSSSIQNWFGTDHLAANGAIVAPLQGSGVFANGDQYFEFWGIDDASGQHWYRVAVVTFQ